MCPRDRLVGDALPVCYTCYHQLLSSADSWLSPFQSFSHPPILLTPPDPRCASLLPSRPLQVKERIDARNALETYVYNMKQSATDKLKDKLTEEELEKASCSCVFLGGVRF